MDSAAYDAPRSAPGPAGAGDVDTDQTLHGVTREWRSLAAAARDAAAFGDHLTAGGRYDAAADLAHADGAPADGVRLRCDAVDAFLAAPDPRRARACALKAADALTELDEPGEWMTAASLVNTAVNSSGLLRKSLSVTAEMVARADHLGTPGAEPDHLRARTRSIACLRLDPDL